MERLAAPPLVLDMYIDCERERQTNRDMGMLKLKSLELLSAFLSLHE